MKLRNLFLILAAIIFSGCNAKTAAVKNGSSSTGNIAETDRNLCIKEDARNASLAQLKSAVKNCHTQDNSGNGRMILTASKTPRPLIFDLVHDSYVEEQLETTGLLSYLLYRDGKVVVDMKTPSNRMGDVYDDDTLFTSQSVGKSLTGYLVGHAICAGYIESLDATLSDWPLFQNTLYENQKVIDMLNMRAGDAKYVKSNQIKFANPQQREGVNHQHMAYWGQALQGTAPSSFKQFNYSQLVSNIMHNYVQFKAGDNYQNLIESLYRSKVGIENNIGIDRVDVFSNISDGLLTTNVYATRYDFLRMAIAILEDWQSDTCEGKYLKDLYARRISGNDNHGLFRWRFNGYKTNYKYAGYFHTDASRVKGRHFIMNGYAGQYILINFDTGVIVATQAAHEDFITKKLVVDAANNAAR